MIDITIPLRTLTLNQLLRTHYFARRQHLKLLATEIRVAAGPPPRQPIERARVQVHRYTPNVLDPDGRDGIAKGILDVLQPYSKRHPFGMGYIRGDDPHHLELSTMLVRSTQVATRIIIEALP